MKANQIASFQKCLLLKSYKQHKKASRTELIKKKAWCSVLKINECAVAKHMMS